MNLVPGLWAPRSRGRWVACLVGLHLCVKLAIWLTLSAASGLDFQEHSTLLCKEPIVSLSRRKGKSHSVFHEQWTEVTHNHPDTVMFGGLFHGYYSYSCFIKELAFNLLFLQELQI